MEITIQMELGEPNTYQAEVLLAHGNDACYETKWFMLNAQDDVKLLVRICDTIHYKKSAAGWIDPDCTTEDVAARIAAILNENETHVRQLISSFHRTDAKFDEVTADFVAMRVHYFDRYGVMHRVVVDGKEEFGTSHAFVGSSFQ